MQAFFRVTPPTVPCMSSNWRAEGQLDVALASLAIRRIARTPRLWSRVYASLPHESRGRGQAATRRAAHRGDVVHAARRGGRLARRGAGGKTHWFARARVPRPTKR